MTVGDLHDLAFKPRDTPEVLVRKLEALRRAAITSSLAAPTTGKALVRVTNHGRDRGILTPETIPEATVGEFTTAIGENDVFEVCDGADLVTVAWMPISTDLLYRGEWRARLTKEPVTGTAKAHTSITVYDADGRYLGDVAPVEQEATWTVSDGWKTYRSQISGVALRAAHSTGAYVRAALRREGDACAVTQISRASINTYLLIEGEGGTPEEWAAVAESHAQAADTSRTAAQQAEANTEAARLLAQAALLEAQEAEAAAIAEALAAAASASVSAAHATTSTTKASEAEGSASAAAASATVAQGHNTNADTSAAAAASSATAAAISVTDAASFASAAQTARLAAESARDESEASAEASFDSEQSAGTYASAAGTYAGAADVSRIAAQTAQTGAESSASAASTFAATASAQAAVATASAVLAATHASDAGSWNSAYLNRNPNFDQGSVGWSQGHSDDSLPGMSGGDLLASANGRTNVWNGAGYFIGYSQFIPIAGNEKLEMTAGFYVSAEADAENAIYYLGIVPYDATKTSLTGGGAHYFLSDGEQPAGWRDLSAIMDVAATYPTARYVRLITIWNYPYGGNPAPAGVTQVDYVRLLDVTQKKAAETSATIATAAAATASADAATATTSKNLAATYRDEAEDARDSAASSASLATTERVAASAAAASAQQSLTLTAAIVGGGLVKDPTFSAFPTTPGVPTHWAYDSLNVAGDANPSTRVAGVLGGHAWRLLGEAGQGNHSSQFVAEPLITNGWYVIEADVRLNGGALTGAGSLFYVQSATNAEALYLTFSTDPDESGSAPGAGTVGKPYRFRKLIQVTLANVIQYRLYALSHNAALGSIAAANDIIWDRLNIRAATPAEIRDQTVLPGLVTTSATHTSQIAVLADTDSAQASSITSLTARMETAEGNITTEQSVTATQTAQIATISARYTVTLDVNGHVSGFSLIGTGGGSSEFIVKASTFKIALPGYAARQLFSVSADKIQFGTDLYAGAYKLIFDNGSVMQVIGTGFGSSNQFIEWFGPSMAISSCTEANGTSWKKTNGDAYFGGTLSAGILRNAASTSLISSNASIALGPFGTNGGPIQVITSYAFTSQNDQSLNIYPATSQGIADWDDAVAAWGATHNGVEVSAEKTISCSVVVTVDRDISGSVTSGWATLTISSATEGLNGSRPTLPDGDGWLVTNQAAGGSITSTDNTGGTGDRTFTATITTRTGLALLSFQTQKVGLVAIEE